MTREFRKRLAGKCGMLEYFWTFLAEAVSAAPPAEWDVIIIVIILPRY